MHAAGINMRYLGLLAPRAQLPHGESLSRGGCQNRWHSLIKCNHVDSITDLDAAPQLTLSLN
jgi:hypothetical protein